MNTISRKAAKSLGLKRYFTGKPCKYGHVADRFCASGRCSEFDSVLQKSPEYRAQRRIYENLPHMKEKRRRYEQTESRKSRQNEISNARYHQNKPQALMRLLVSRFPRMIRMGMAGMRTREKLGYTLDEFKTHIESKFKSGMTWNNHGEWHIDHIRPVSSFSHEEAHKINELINLQPLWSYENLSKGDRCASP